MPQIFIATEVPYRTHDTKDRVIHEIQIPEFTEPGFYRQVTSLNSFTSGKRAGLNARERQCHRVTPAWAPGRLYNVKHFEEWNQDVGAVVDSMRKHGHDWLDEREMPRIKHASIWAFYAHIGWDRKRRRYVDAEGNAIKYSAA